MIAACPKCKTRFRIARERLTPEGVRLRCSQCSGIFRVKAPEDRPSGAEREAPARPAPRPAPASATETRPAPAAPPPPPAPRRDPERLVVVAHSDAALCKSVVDALESWGLEALAASDGVEAILAVQRALPRAVVLDAGLAKMYGFQVCELIKRNESLRSIRVVLVGAVYDATRYRRPPRELYGADLYLEPGDVPDGLHAVLAGFGLPLRRAERAPQALERPVPLEPAAPPPAAVPEPAEREPARAPSRPGAGEGEVAKAERLARIIVSDVILYNEAKFEAAVAAGNVVAAMEADLQEGRSLFQARIAPAVAGQRDFLREELLRVAGQRGLR